MSWFLSIDSVEKSVGGELHSSIVVPGFLRVAVDVAEFVFELVDVVGGRKSVTVGIFVGASWVKNFPIF